MQAGHLREDLRTCGGDQVSIDKCPHCGGAVEICFARLDGGTQAPVILKCHSVKGSGTITHSILCQESAARKKAEAQVVNLTTENELLAMSVMTLKAQLENLKSSNASSGPYQSHYEGDTCDEYHRGFGGHGY